jgi:phage tail sheath protein FI
MAELTFKSAGVSSREIDLSFPSQTQPSGVPAGIVGTSKEGPAFIPITVSSFSEFQSLFGASDGKKFGPIAVAKWLENSNSCTYVRVLGIGDGKKRSSTGTVTNAGFYVGDQLPDGTRTVGVNSYANAGSVIAGGAGPLGRTHFLGCFMSESAGSTYLSDAGLQANTGSYPIIRGVILTPSGVIASLSGSSNTNKSPNQVSANPAYLNGNIYAGSITGSVKISDSSFVMYLNGHKSTSNYKNIITASFDVNSPKYISKIFNTNPLNYQKAGHLLYSHFDVHSNLAVVTGSGILNLTDVDVTVQTAHGLENIAFMLTSSLSRTAAATSVIPKFEDFNDRFRHAISPYVISQNTGGVYKNLFRFHALSAGELMNKRIKISIENISRRNGTSYGSFDVVVRDYSDSDELKIVLESFRNVNLDPNSDRFIGRAIGDIDVFYDFDKTSIDQRINIKGDYPVRSRFIRVELTDAVKAGNNVKTILPFGFRAPLTLNTSGSILSFHSSSDYNHGYRTIHQKSLQPPIPYRKNVTIGIGTKKKVDTRFYWGVQNTKVISATDPNTAASLDPTIDNLVKYFPRQMTNSANFIDASDSRNNNIFNLSKIVVVTASNGKADEGEWTKAAYFRNGIITGSASSKTKAFDVADLEIASNRKYAKFTMPMQGGFDGVNIFDEEKLDLSNNAALNEVLDSTQGGVNGPTVNSYKKGIDVLGSKADADIQLLAIPGIREPVVTNHAITTVENRFDAVYLMDIQEYDNAGSLITGSVGNINIVNTVNSFKNRALDSSFTAAYFPDVFLEDPSTKTKLFVPPSIAALGAYSLNDAVAHPWFAPAGFSRGSLKNVEAAAVKLSRKNLDDLYENKINPITSFPGTGLVIFGQKTLLEAASSLDRVNVRRLLINVRRAVRSVANSLLFEPNREETLERFNSLVNPILQRVQDKGGVDRFKVVIDTSTTTQADVENNTLRGKIFLQPTRTVEFIALDFVVTNAGAEI